MEFDSVSKVSGSFWVCGTCGVGNPPAISYCTSCRKKRPVPSKKKTDLKTQKTEDKLKPWLCTTCKVANSPQTPLCASCFHLRFESFKETDLVKDQTQLAQVMGKKEKENATQRFPTWTCLQCTYVQSWSSSCSLCGNENPFLVQSIPQSAPQNLQSYSWKTPLSENQEYVDSLNYNDDINSSSNHSRINNSNSEKVRENHIQNETKQSETKEISSFSLNRSIVFLEEIVSYGSFWCDSLSCRRFNAEYLTNPRFKGNGIYRIHCASCGQEQQGMWKCVECQRQNILKKLDPKNPQLHKCATLTCSFHFSGTHVVFISYKNHCDLKRGDINDQTTQEYWRHQSAQCSRKKEKENLEAEFLFWFTQNTMQQKKTNQILLQLLVNQKPFQPQLQKNKAQIQESPLNGNLQSKKQPTITLQNVKQLVESKADVFYRDSIGRNFLQLFFEAQICRQQKKTERQCLKRIQINQPQIQEWEKIAFYFMGKGINPFVCTDLGTPQLTPWPFLNSYFLNVRVEKFNFLYFLDWIKFCILYINRQKKKFSSWSHIRTAHIQLLLFEFCVGIIEENLKKSFLRWFHLLTPFLLQ